MNAQMSFSDNGTRLLHRVVWSLGFLLEDASAQYCVTAAELLFPDFSKDARR